MPAYIAHVNVTLTLRVQAFGYDEADGAANAETLALAILRGQFDKSEMADAEVTCGDVTCLDPDGRDVVGPQG